MPSTPVHFLYATGVMPTLFSNARLVGSWDPDGRYSEQWSTRGMEAATGPDGCPAFVASVLLDAEQAGWTFYWGVELDGPPGQGRWGIMTEEGRADSMRPIRSFQLAAPSGGAGQQEVYYLNHSRRLGAQKHYRNLDPNERAGIRFAVWAPNATAVEVRMGTLWSANDPTRQSISDLANPRGAVGRAVESRPRELISGGYIADGDGAGSDAAWGPFPMRREAGDLWVTDAADPGLADFRVFDHAPYMFRVTKDDGTVRYRSDLYSRCQIGYGGGRPSGPFSGRTVELDGSVSCSVVIDPDLVATEFLEPLWPETRWTAQDAFFADPAPDPALQQLDLADLVIYELHVGALGASRRLPNQPGTLEDALGLLDHLQDLGVNAIELLPLSEFGGGGAGWGYATSHYFAIEYAGGGRDQYKHFIRECHRRGMAVILDVVYNHFSHNAERAEWMYDTNRHERNPYYWYEGRPDDYPEFNRNVGADSVGQGGYVDNLSSGWAPCYWREIVRNMFVSSAVAQAIEFGVDGFRVDQTTSIHAYNASHADGRRLDHVNAFGAKLLRELTRSLKFVKPRIMLMAEDHSNWDGVTRAPDQGGLGFDATWYADFYHHLIGDTDKGSDYAKLIKTAGLGDDRPLAMDYFAGALQATGSGQMIVYHESHDEAGNGQFTDRTIRVAVDGAPLFGDTRRYAEARCRFAAGVTMLSAGIPMFLFGEEVGAENRFLYDHVLENREDLPALRASWGRYLFRFYQELIRLRRAHEALRSRAIDVVFVHNEHRLIVFRRWRDDRDFLVVGSLSNHPFDSPTYVFRADRLPGGRWREVFNSDATAYGGNNVGNGGATIEARPGMFECVVPANGIVVFQRVG